MIIRPGVRYQAPNVKLSIIYLYSRSPNPKLNSAIENKWCKTNLQRSRKPPALNFDPSHIGAISSN